MLQFCCLQVSASQLFGDQPEPAPSQLQPVKPKKSARAELEKLEKLLAATVSEDTRSWYVESEPAPWDLDRATGVQGRRLHCGRKGHHAVDLHVLGSFTSVPCTAQLCFCSLLTQPHQNAFIEACAEAQAPEQAQQEQTASEQPVVMSLKRALPAVPAEVLQRQKEEFEVSL
jgi:hypothetical protein